MHDFDTLARELQPYYSRFDVANRLLFTGHSHQAWPDAAFDGLDEYARIVSKEVDKKWNTGFEKTDILRTYLRNFYDDPDGLYCREQNTHVLIVSWLSSLDLKNKPRIITTQGEFHSMYRQLRRLQEIGIEVIYLPHQNDDQLFKALKKELKNHQTAAVMLSRVYFESAEINTRCAAIARYVIDQQVPVLIDDYHGTNVVPISIREENLDQAYFLIGGYKYLQWGEANCFLRYPENCGLSPVVTGWFSAFDQLNQPRDDKPVTFDDGNQKFATGTYDPISQFRAAAVVRFFKELNLTPELLQRQYSAQVETLRNLFDDLNHVSSGLKHANLRSMDETAGFLSLRSEEARNIQTALMKDGVFTDARDNILRIGPAPYTTAEQCRQVIRKVLEKTK